MMETINPIDLKRRNDIDWLRIFATIVIFFFHSARAFDDIPWEIKNGETYIGFTLFVVFTHAWIMPLFFMLSGISTFYALGHRSQTEFVKERTQRLLIPYIFGICTVLAIQVYFEALFGNEWLPPFKGNFFEFYFLNYFTRGIYDYGGYFPLGGIYLWYLSFLFIFSIITVKLFVYLRKINLKNKFLKLAEFCGKPGGILILLFPLILVQLIGIIVLPFLINNGWSVLTYLLIFIYGFIIASNDKFREATEKNAILTLIIGIISSIFFIIGFFNMSAEIDLITIVIILLVMPLCCLCWLATILGFASKYANKNSKYLKFLSDIVLPFYIIHQSIIIMCNFYIIQLNISIWLKFLLVVLMAF
ncbi:MAG: acyltransferase, partial [Candidatus Hermodarchaeota archaeon]